MKSDSRVYDSLSIVNPSSGKKKKASRGRPGYQVISF
nr:MAG TPA: hypothetical protein [Caudoviricetes sp.]